MPDSSFIIKHPILHKFSCTKASHNPPLCFFVCAFLLWVSVCMEIHMYIPSSFSLHTHSTQASMKQSLSCTFTKILFNEGLHGHVSFSCHIASCNVPRTTHTGYKPTYESHQSPKTFFSFTSVKGNFPRVILRQTWKENIMRCRKSFFHSLAFFIIFSLWLDGTDYGSIISIYEK